VAFTRQYVQTNLEVHRQVPTTLAELTLGGLLPSGSVEPGTDNPTAQDVA
jgi:hypothetical protein